MNVIEAIDEGCWINWVEIRTRHTVRDLMRVPLCPYTLVTLCPYTLLPLCPYALIPLYPYTLIPLYPYTLIPLYPYTLIPLYPYARIPLYPYTLVLEVKDKASAQRLSHARLLSLTTLAKSDSNVSILIVAHMQKSDRTEGCIYPLSLQFSAAWRCTAISV